MNWTASFGAGRAIASRAELLDRGLTGHTLTALVRNGVLIRVRRDHYALPDTPNPILQAVRVGGRVTCVSALQLASVFVFDATFPHVHLDEAASRLRSPRNRFERLTESNRYGAELHWWPVTDPRAGNEFAVGIRDALAHSIRCQHRWHALASIDNALFSGAISESDLGDIFANVPERHRYLRDQLDGRAEAGQETVLRRIVLEAGLYCDLQVNIETVGRVDIVVEGRLALEADSRLAHDGWERHVSDRYRDLNLAKLELMSLRPAYQHTMHEPDLVRDGVLGLLRKANKFRSYLA